jgi:hypothetical protein
MQPGFTWVCFWRHAAFVSLPDCTAASKAAADELQLHSHANKGMCFKAMWIVLAAGFHLQLQR